MLNSLRKACISNVQLQQVRLGHRVRGKAPVFCRTIKERLDELNYKDELYTTRIDIGFSRPKNLSSELRDARLEHMKKIKSDKNLEQLARKHKLKVDLNEVRNEWLNTLGPHHKKQLADHYGIFGHLYGEGYFVPFKNLDVFYDLKDQALPVYSGNVIKPSEALSCPTVSYESDGNTMWTLVLSSLDGHLKENDKEYLHWCVANIPGNHIEKGDSLAEYLQPFPLKGTGYHRYVFVLYKQNERITYDIPQGKMKNALMPALHMAVFAKCLSFHLCPSDKKRKRVTSSSPLDSRTFVTREWYQKYQDKITPAGLAFFQTDWDHSVKDYFYNVLNMKEPVYEYDFPGPYIKPQKWFPKKQPFNLYMDKYRDPKQINKEYLLRKLDNVDPFTKPAPRLRFPNAHALPKSMPSWLKLHEKKIRLKWGRINDV